MSGSDRSWRGEKQMTRHSPVSPSARSSPATSSDAAGPSGVSAAKSLVKTNVPV
jgi:hypothetical protein